MKILYGIAPKTHVNLALDEIAGLSYIGYVVRQVPYGKNDLTLNIIQKIWGAIKNALNIITVLREFKPEVLFLNSRFEKAGCVRDFISVLLIRLFYWRKLIILIKTHGSDFFQSRYAVYDKPNFILQSIVLPYLRNNVNGWLFLSLEEINTINSYSLGFENKLFLIPNIINPARCFSPLSIGLELDSSKWKILFCGRMVLEKGCWDVLEAIPNMTHAKECQFIFLGDGPELESLKKRAKELGFKPDSLLFPGFIEEELSDPIFGIVQAFVFPTYFKEGFAMALFKAVACGLPIVTTKCRASKDYLIEPNNTIWVEPKDPVGVAKALDYLYENVAIQESMKVHNIQLGKSFSKTCVSKKIDTTILELLEKNKMK